MYVYVENGRGQGTVDTCLSLQRGTPKSPTRRASQPHEARLIALLGVPSEENRLSQSEADIENEQSLLEQ